MKLLCKTIAWALFGAVLTVGSASAQTQPEKLRIMLLNPLIATDYPLFLANKLGIFAKHGIAPEFISSTNPITPLLAGDVDVANSGSANGLVVVTRGQDFQFLGAMFPRSTVALLVKPDSPLAKVAHKWPESFTQLKGKKLGVTVAGAQIDLTARWLALLAGLTPDKDITIHAAGDATALIANLDSGTYDAALVPSPLFEAAIAKKIGVSILDAHKGEGPKELGLFPYAAPGSRKSFVDSHKDLMKRFMAAMQETVDYAKKPENRAKVTELVAAELKVDPKSLEAPMDTFIDAIGSVKFSRSQWDNAIAMMKANGIVKQDYAYETYVFEGGRAD